MLKGCPLEVSISLSLALLFFPCFGYFYAMQI
jgi:hypothetical protein